MSTDPGAPRATEEPRVEILRMKTDLDDVMRYYAGGYELGDAELLEVQYAITPNSPRRVWLQLTVRHEDADDHR